MTKEEELHIAYPVVGDRWRDYTPHSLLRRLVAIVPADDPILFFVIDGWEGANSRFWMLQSELASWAKRTPARLLSGRE